MGGSQSTRKVTVDNENAIQVSQEALDRIQSQLNSKPSVEPRAQPLQQYTPPSYDYKRRHEYAAEEAYWAQRVESLKRQHDKINSGMQSENQKTLKEAHEIFNMVQGDKVATKLAPCQEEKAKVLQCYNTNPGKSLLCSMLVNEFSDCVCKSRVAAVSS